MHLHHYFSWDAILPAAIRKIATQLALRAISPCEELVIGCDHGAVVCSTGYMYHFHA